MQYAVRWAIQHNITEKKKNDIVMPTRPIDMRFDASGTTQINTFSTLVHQVSPTFQHNDNEVT